MPFPCSPWFAPLRGRALALSLLLAFVFGVSAVHAQVQVQISLSRRSYILYEPIIATIIVNNFAGQDLNFHDEGGKQWFNVEMTTTGEVLIPPYDPDYKLSPLTVPAGKSVKRQIDLTPLFPVRDMGLHRIRASVYLADTDKFYSSNYTSFDLTDGHVLWAQNVGAHGEVRQMSLLTHHLLDKIMLYVRVRDADGPNVYTTQSIGRVIVTGSEPQTQLDSQNTLHVLHEAVPKGFYYTRIDADGVRLGQTVYTSEGRDRPHLVKLPSGEVEVRGGHVQTAVATAVEAVSPTRGFNGPSQPKLSDRPAGLPPAVRRTP